MKSLFESVELAPRDPIFGLTEQYNADTRPGKVNLGVGVYNDDHGRLPLLKAVRQAELANIEAASARGYLRRVFGQAPSAVGPAGADESASLESFHRDLIRRHLERDLRSLRVLRDVAREVR